MGSKDGLGTAALKGFKRLVACVPLAEYRRKAQLEKDCRHEQEQLARNGSRVHGTLTTSWAVEKELDQALQR